MPALRGKCLRSKQVGLAATPQVEVQTFTTTADAHKIVGGSFTLSYQGSETIPILSSAPAESVAAALEQCFVFFASSSSSSTARDSSTNVRRGVNAERHRSGQALLDAAAAASASRATFQQFVLAFTPPPRTTMPTGSSLRSSNARTENMRRQGLQPPR